MLDHETCYRAVSSRDPRFDGWFVTAVRTTGIYCRPSCPATTPKRRNVDFFPTSAAAQLAGFRACRRCRPDASPGSPEWNVRSDTVARAMRLIGDGAVDREGVTGLASRLGYSERQLHRVLVAEVGAGAQALARAQRAHTARTLIETTDLKLSEVAFAAGFASIRQFNDTVRAVFATTPRDLRDRSRRPRRRSGPRHDGAAAGEPAAVRRPLAARPAGQQGRPGRRGVRRHDVPPGAPAAARGGHRRPRLAAPRGGPRPRHAAPRRPPRRGARGRPGPAAARPRRRLRGRRRAARRRPVARRPRRRPTRDPRARRRRRSRDGGPGRHRPAGLGRRRAHRGRPAGDARTASR